MCLARVRLVDEDEAVNEVMDDVARIERTDEGILVTGLLGGSQTLRAVIRSIDFIESIVVVEKRKEG